MNILDKSDIGTAFTSPEGHDTSQRPLDGFADDVTCWINRFAQQLDLFQNKPYDHLESLEILVTVIHDARILSQNWEKLLWSTGGKLNLDKCFYYVLHWSFDERGKARLLSK